MLLLGTNRKGNSVKMKWNGNEIVFADKPNVGIAGIAPGVPDEIGQQIADRWNAVDDISRGLCSNSRNHAATICGQIVDRMHNAANQASNEVR